MKYFAKIIVSFLLLTACASTTENKLPQKDELTRFFKVCESDIKKAVEVIRKHKIAEILNHFLIMGGGGKKYYLLEKENISEMILAVTEGTYSDLLLLNSNGTVIYAMKNDDLFSKSLKNGLAESSLNKCFVNSSSGVLHIEDISIFPPLTENKSLLVSYPDIAEGQIKGIFIIQINHEIIENVFTRKIQIIGSDGLYRICDTSENILTPYPYMNNVDIEGLNNGQMRSFLCGEKMCSLYRFKFSTLDWAVILPAQ